MDRIKIDAEYDAMPLSLFSTKYKIDPDFLEKNQLVLAGFMFVKAKKRWAKRKP